MDDLLKATLPLLVEVGAPLLLTVIGGLVSLALNSLRRFFDNAAADRLFDQLEKATAITVQSLEQTLVPEIRKASSDGYIGPAEAKRLKFQAELRIKQVLGTKTMKRLKKDMAGELSNAIDSMIESKVGELRRANTLPEGVVAPKKEN